MSQDTRQRFRDQIDLFREFGFILLLTVWGKSDKSDLSASDRNAVAAIVRDIRRALEARGDR
jgi:hypothetical protein